MLIEDPQVNDGAINFTWNGHASDQDDSVV
jgi:hypothetical protein